MFKKMFFVTMLLLGVLDLLAWAYLQQNPTFPVEAWSFVVSEWAKFLIYQQVPWVPPEVVQWSIFTVAVLSGISAGITLQKQSHTELQIVLVSVLTPLIVWAALSLISPIIHNGLAMISGLTGGAFYLISLILLRPEKFSWLIFIASICTGCIVAILLVVTFGR